FHDNRFHLRYVERRHQVVVQKGRVFDPALVVNNQLFVQGSADAHGETAFNLSDAVQRIDRFSDVMGRNDSEKTHSTRFLVHRDLSSLRRIHIERRGVVAVSRLRIDVFTKLVRVGSVPADDSIGSQLRPNHLTYRQRTLRIYFQKYLTIRKAKILLWRFEDFTCHFRDLLASMNSRMPNGVAHMKRAAA